MNRRNDISTEEIVRLYFDEKISTVKIGERINCPARSVKRRLNNAGFKLRTVKEAHILNPTKYWEGKHISYEHNKKLQEGKINNLEENGHWSKGKTKETNESLMDISKKLTGKKLTESHKKKLSESWDYDKHVTPERIIKTSISMKNLWNNEYYKIKMIKILLKSSLVRPTSYEEKISSLCIRNNLPFIYTGNGTFLIGHKNPDFVDKENKIAIEVFNSYHKIKNYGSIENYIKEREEYFAKFGYKTIFIIEEEIEDNNWEEICLNKIQEAII